MWKEGKWKEGRRRRLTKTWGLMMSRRKLKQQLRRMAENAPNTRIEENPRRTGRIEGMIRRNDQIGSDTVMTKIRRVVEKTTERGGGNQIGTKATARTMSRRMRERGKPPLLVPVLPHFILEKSESVRSRQKAG